MANYYRKFVKDYSNIAQPLNGLLIKQTPFKWTKDCQTAFAKRKDALTLTPVLAYPNFERPFILSCDASGMASGYVLSQMGSENKEHVIAYGGRALTKAEKAYAITAANHFRVYLLHSKFIVYTDHKALTWLKTIKHTNPRLVRWAILI